MELSEEARSKLTKLGQLLGKASIYTHFVASQIHTTTTTTDSDSDVMYQPSSLVTGGQLRPYQQVGVKWLLSLYSNGLNGILADEMGLGKTFQCISFLAHLIEQGVPGPFLIVGPLSTIGNWKAEFQKFTPRIRVMLYHGVKADRERMRRDFLGQVRMDAPGDEYHVLITSYELILHDAHFFRFSVPSWKYLIIDEGHRLKNLNCRLVKTLATFRTENRLLLTGTPLQNRLGEVWALMNFCMPDVFDDLDAFESWFRMEMFLPTSSSTTAAKPVVGPENKDQEDAVEQHDNNDDGDDALNGQPKLGYAELTQAIISNLHQLLEPFILRRLKSDVELSVPHKREYVLYADLTREQREIYDQLLKASLDKRNGAATPTDVLEEGAKRKRKRVDYTEQQDEDEFGTGVEWDDLTTSSLPAEYLHSLAQHNKGKQLDVRGLQNLLMQLRKCCNHPYLFQFPRDPQTHQLIIDDRLRTASGKMRLLAFLLQRLFERGHKVLVFSQMTTQLDLIAEFCEFHGIQYCHLDGSMAQPDRQAQIARFSTDPEIRVFLLSTRAGGLGINLTAADSVILYDSDWNPQMDAQAQDRCHRIGQTRPVIVYRLATRGTVEEKVLERADGKRRLERMVMHRSKFKMASVTLTRGRGGQGGIAGGLSALGENSMMRREQAIQVEDLLEILQEETYTLSQQHQPDMEQHGTEDQQDVEQVWSRDVDGILDRSDEAFRIEQQQGSWFKLVQRVTLTDGADEVQTGNESGNENVVAKENQEDKHVTGADGDGGVVSAKKHGESRKSGKGNVSKKVLGDSVGVSTRTKMKRSTMRSMHR